MQGKAAKRVFYVFYVLWKIKKYIWVYEYMEVNKNDYFRRFIQNIDQFMIKTTGYICYSKRFGLLTSRTS